MELAPYIDRNSAHEAIYKSVSREGSTARGVLVRPNILVSLDDAWNVNEPDIVAATEEEVLNRLLWVKLGHEDSVPEGFSEVYLEGHTDLIQGFFYVEYDLLDETIWNESRFHGLMSNGSDITVDADDVWVRPWEDEPEARGPVFRVKYSPTWKPDETETGFFAWVPERYLFRGLSAKGVWLNSAQYTVKTIDKVQSVGDVVDAVEASCLKDEGFRLQEVSKGVYVVTEVPPEVREALRWL